MKLQEALLCVDCESLYSLSSHCPNCGSQVCFPLERALNRSRSTASARDTNPLRAIAQRSPPATARTVRSAVFLHQTA